MTENCSPTPDANPGTPPPLGRAWLAWFLILPLAAMGIADPMSAEQLMLGWLYLPLQSLSRMTVEWPTVLLAGIILPLFVAMLATPIERRGILWPARQARRITVLLFLTFAVGTATIGLAHQAIWLVQGSGPRAEKTSPVPLLSPIVNAARDASDSPWKSGFRDLTLGIHSFLTAQKGRFPAGGTITADGRQLHSWMTVIGPYYGLSTEDVRFDLPWHDEPNARLFRCQTYYFVNPQMSELFDAEGFGLSHIAANVRLMPIGVVPDSAHPRFIDRMADQSYESIHDGASHTILLGQVVENLQPWGSPRNVRDPAVGLGDPNGFGALPQERGVLVAMVDGSVRTLSTRTDASVMRALATPDGGEAAPSFDE